MRAALTLRRVLAIFLLVLAGAPVWGQGSQTLRQDWFSEEDLAVALFHESGAGEAEREPMHELFSGYIGESTRAFQEAALALETAGRTKNEDPQWRDKREAAIFAYEQTQARLDAQLLGDLAVLLPDGVAAAERMNRLLGQLRQLRSSQAGAGRHAHPLVAWHRAFPQRRLPPEGAAVRAAYEHELAARLEASTAIYNSPAPAPGRDNIRRTARLRQIDLDIMRVSDARAEELAGLLPAGESRQYLQQYYRNRWPDLYYTEVDRRLEAIQPATVKEQAVRQIDAFRERYWQHLRVINTEVQRAETSYMDATIESALDEISFSDLDDARQSRREALARREERLAPFIREVVELIASMEREEDER